MLFLDININFEQQPSIINNAINCLPQGQISHDEILFLFQMQISDNTSFL
jgi:hypothetical protein